MCLVLTVITSPSGAVIGTSLVDEDLFTKGVGSQRSMCPVGDYQAIKKAIDTLLPQELVADRYKVAFYQSMWDRMQESGYRKTTKLVEVGQ